MGAGAPFLLLVYSKDCGHCTRMMPAFNQMLSLLGPAHCVVQLAVSALRGAKDTSMKRLILSRVHGVPFVAMIHRHGREIVPLPPSSDRSASSMSSFALSHFSGR